MIYIPITHDEIEVGDKVLIHNNGMKQWSGDRWACGMDITLGHIGEVIYKSDGNERYNVGILVNGKIWNYHASHLRVPMKVDEQLTFEFMKEGL